MTTESKTLLENIAAGDNEAFKTLFDMFFPKVKVFLVKFLKDDKAAEDIAQDIFVKIWTFGPTLPEIKSFNTYIYRMTRNAALNYLSRSLKLYPWRQTTDPAWYQERN